MRKILVIHNKYRIRGGEDIAVENEVKLLKKFYEVKELYFSNTIEKPILQTFSFLFNKNTESAKALEKEVENFNPDIAYVHNTWFKASPEVFNILDKKNIKTIIKLHNFRYDCTRHFLIKKHLKGKEECSACGISKKGRFLFNKYFIDSYLKSFFVLIYGKKYFNILSNSKNIIFVLTKFHKEYLSKINSSFKSVHVFPNYLNIYNKEFTKEAGKQYIVYAGRISKEKGIEDLIKGFLNSKLDKFNLKIIGVGPYQKTLKEKYDLNNIHYLGELHNEKVLEIISNSSAVITATKLYEGQPTLLCEASMLGVPSIYPVSGGIHEFFPSDSKLSYQQSNLEDLTNKLDLILDNELLEIEGVRNKEFISKYLSEESLINEFEKILENEK